MSQSEGEQLKAARRLLAQRRARDAYGLCRQILISRPDHPEALALAGAALSAGGKVEPAIEHLRRSLALAPDQIGAEVDLALALRTSGRDDEALERINRTARRHPDNAAVLNTQGLLLGGAGRHRQAAEVLDRAWRLSNRHPGVGFNLGEAQRRAGEAAAATGTFESILSREPGHVASINSLGLVLLAEGRFDAAAARFRTALQHRPGDRRFGANLAHALERAGRIGEAVEVLKSALDRAPGNVELILQLARLYREVDEFEAARTAYEKALEADPQRLEALRELAWLEEQSNRAEAAAQAAARGLAVHPQDPGLRLLEARRARRQGDLEQARLLLDAIDETMLDETNRASFYSERGNLADAGEDPAAAWREFCRRGASIVESSAAARCDRDRYPSLVASWGEALEAWSMPDVAPAPGAPVFVMGFPRSGTTLLDQFLGGHPDLITMEEKPALDAVVARAAELDVPLPGSLRSLTDDQLAALKTRYWEAVASFAAGAETRQLVDRLPVNVPYLPLIQALWPGARVVFAARDPLDVCLSCLMQDFRLNPLTWHLADPDRCVSLYCSFAELWLRFAQRAPALSHVVRYENLVTAPEDTCRALTSFLGLRWHDAMLDHVATAKSRQALRTASYHQVVQPLYRGALGRWRRYRAQLERWRDALEPYREQFGYGSNGELD